MGILDCPASTLMGETMPQLRFTLQKRGQILWPRIQHQVEAAFSPSDEQARKIVDDERKRRALAPGQTLPRSSEDATRDLAWAIVASRWTGIDPFASLAAQKAAPPIGGMHPDAAAAVLAWAVSDDCPPAIFAHRILPLLKGLEATAAQPREK